MKLIFKYNLMYCFHEEVYFQTKYLIGYIKCANFIVDEGSTKNLVSYYVINKLKLKCRTHQVLI